jgi:hypothetical protein
MFGTGVERSGGRVTVAVCHGFESGLVVDRPTIVTDNGSLVRGGRRLLCEGELVRGGSDGFCRARKRRVAEDVHGRRRRRREGQDISLYLFKGHRFEPGTPDTDTRGT